MQSNPKALVPSNVSKINHQVLNQNLYSRPIFLVLTPVSPYLLDCSAMLRLHIKTKVFNLFF